MKLPKLNGLAWSPSETDFALHKVCAKEKHTYQRAVNLKSESISTRRQLRPTKSLQEYLTVKPVHFGQ